MTGFSEQELVDFGYTKTEIKRMNRRARKENAIKHSKSARGNSQLLQDFKRSQTPIKHLRGQTQKQHELLKNIAQYDQVVCTGPAGTGKTYCISAFAAIAYMRGEINKIVITRANVPTGKSLGFYPGSLEDKMLIWLQPVVQVLKEFMGPARFDIALKNGDIVLQPIETIRGMSFSNSFVIVDEAQNITIDEIKAILTRIGEGSKIVLNGDTTQKDLKHMSGLEFIANAVNHNKALNSLTGFTNFTLDDVVRSKVCKEWVSYFYHEGF